MSRNNGSGGDGYQLYANYAQSIGRGSQWVAWSEDETCSQRNVTNDTERAHSWTLYCDRPAPSGGGTPTGGGGDNNDSPGSATALSPGTVSGSISSSTDVDYYRFTLSSSQSVTLELRFSHSAGDLDMSLTDASGASLGLAQSSSDNEVLTPTLGAGTYTLKVYGYSGAQGTYQLELRLADAEATSSGACGDAGSTAESAVAIDGNRSGLRICANESDYWRYTPNFNGNLQTTIRFEHSMGDLDLSVTDASGNVQTSQGTENTETVAIAVTSGTPVIIRVYGYSGATGDYSLEIGPQ
jgi:hypothetical protein